ncbi:MAG: lipid-A-disaccharide synthase [Syntrophobacterales bacterium]|nr:MAG: lipid-A-disaccharide synthase [Syntrophobacterales bacterium]
MNRKGERKILIVAGETSGDLHGAHLVKAALSLDPNLRFYGVGGKHLRSIGIDVVFDSSEVAVVGFVEVISKLRSIYRIFRWLKRSFDCDRPALAILIDFPDFNLRLAKEANKRGIPVFYYISPQVWAWRRGRVKKIAKLVHKLVVILPFEVPFYRQRNIDCEFVGHPLIDIVKPHLSRNEALEIFRLDRGKRTIGLFPGSRREEVQKLLPVLLKSVHLLLRDFPNLQFIVPIAPAIKRFEIEENIARFHLNVRVVEEHIYDVLNICDLIITASGTATLEAAIMNTPMIIIYKVSFLSYLVARLLVKVKNIGLVNLIAEKRIVPELIQGQASPMNIFNETSKMLKNPDLLFMIKGELDKVTEKLGNPGASQRVAQILYRVVRQGA